MKILYYAVPNFDGSATPAPAEPTTEQPVNATPVNAAPANTAEPLAAASAQNGSGSLVSRVISVASASANLLVNFFVSLVNGFFGIGR